MCFFMVMKVMIHAVRFGERFSLVQEPIKQSKVPHKSLAGLMHLCSLTHRLLAVAAGSIK